MGELSQALDNAQIEFNMPTERKITEMFQKGQNADRIIHLVGQRGGNAPVGEYIICTSDGEIMNFNGVIGHICGHVTHYNRIPASGDVVKVALDWPWYFRFEYKTNDDDTMKACVCMNRQCYQI